MRTAQVAGCSIHSPLCEVSSAFPAGREFFFSFFLSVSHQLSCSFDKAQQVLRSPTDELKIMTEEQVDGGVDRVRPEEGRKKEKSSAVKQEHGCMFLPSCATSSENYSTSVKETIACRASKILFIFFFVIDHQDSCCGGFSAVNSSGNFKENITEKIKQKCHRVQRVGRSHSHLNDIDLFIWQ